MSKTPNSRKVCGIVSIRADAGADVPSMIDAINRDFESFKATRTEKDKEIAAKFDDVVTTEKLERMNAHLGEMQAAIDQASAAADQANTSIAAWNMGGGNASADLSSEEIRYQAMFKNWFQTGEEEGAIKAALRSGNIRAAASVGSDPDGGYTVPVEWDRTITNKLVEVSPMRRYASIQSVSGQGFKKLYNTRGSTSGWVGETASRPETDGSKFSEYAFSFGEIYANPAATQAILDDSEIDFAAWMASEVETEFSVQEGAAFINGDGVNKPKGILKYTKADEKTLSGNKKHPLGAIEEVTSGAAEALTSDGLIDLLCSLPSDRQAGAALYGNRKTLSMIRKMKDGDGNYLWQPSFQEGDPATVLGYPVRELSGLPDIAANALPVLFGNMERTYRIFDRTGVRVLRDPYTNKPYVHFYTTKRLGGGLWNPEWMKYHRVAA